MAEISTQNVNLLLAFAGGVITFFASCFLPLVPTYVAYLSGFSSKNILGKYDLLLNALMFSFGFIVVFMIFGYSASKIGNAFGDYRDLFQRLGGVFMILLGLFLLGAFRPIVLFQEFKIKTKINPTKFAILNSFLLGVTFGFAWSPCIGPLLGTILLLAGRTETALEGTLLLLFYGLGISTPFIIVSLMFGKFWERISKIQKYLHTLQLVSGVLVLITGFLIIINKFNYISVLIVESLNLDKFTF